MINPVPPEAGPLDERYYKRLVNSFVLLKNCPGCKPLEQSLALAGLTAAQSAEKESDKPLSPREQLQQYVAKLQQDPDDQALREKIIKLALALEPKPAIPEEAEKMVGRATYVFKNAKTEADYADAVQAYQKALLIAPWVADYYFNLGVAQEKAGKPSEAIASLKFYLMAAPDAPDRRDVVQRIGGLEYAAEKAAKEKTTEAAAKAEEKRRREEAEAVLANLRSKVQGFTYTFTTCDYRSFREQMSALEKEGSTGWSCNWDEYRGKNWYKTPEITKRFNFPGDGTVQFGDNTLIGTPNGPAISDIRWTTGGRVKSPTWVDLAEDGSWIAHSADRPNISSDDPRFDRKARYSYNGYRRQ